MGAFVSISATVSRHNPEKHEAIVKALKSVWGFDTEASYQGTIKLYGEGSSSYRWLSFLGEELGKAVFEANGGPAEIEGSITWLEQAPTEDLKIPEKYCLPEEAPDPEGEQYFCSKHESHYDDECVYCAGERDK